MTAIEPHQTSKPEPAARYFEDGYLVLTGLEKEAAA